MNRVEKWVVEAAQSCLPVGVPLPFVKVISAQSVNKTAVATVEMFDGLLAVLEVSKWSDIAGAWRMCWCELEGGAINWNGDSWERIDEENLLPKPHQIAFDLEGVSA